MGIHISMEQFIQLLPLFIPIIILQIVLIIAAVVSILKKEAPLERTILWIVISLGITIIGPVIYFAIGSKQLEKEVSERKEN